VAPLKSTRYLSSYY